MKGSLLLFVLPTAWALVSRDGVGKLPALGWNSWNAYACNVDEDKILSAAQDLVDKGLQDAGYEYVNIDDCWSVQSGRDNNTGRLQPDLTKFPDGISGTADKIHQMGFKIGIYSDAGTETCGSFPGSLYHEDIDAQTWAEWGIDYLKYDNCNVPSSWPADEFNDCHPDYNHPNGPNATCINEGEAPPGYDWSTSSTAKRFNRMHEALEKQHRTILLSLSCWGQAGVWEWGNSTAASWRMTDDIFSYWARVIHILNFNSFKLNSVNFWGHNDVDMLEVGNGNLTLTETRTHFALWAAMKSPLLIGTDLSTLSDDNLAILKNKWLLDFNQDPVIGEPATPYKWGTNPDWTYNDTFPAEFWSGKSSQHGILVLMINTYSTTQLKTADFSEIPGTIAGASYEVTDVWTGQQLGCFTGSWSADVESHDTAAVLLNLCASVSPIEQKTVETKAAAVQTKSIATY